MSQPTDNSQVSHERRGPISRLSLAVLKQANFGLSHCWDGLLSWAELSPLVKARSGRNDWLRLASHQRLRDKRPCKG